MQMCAIQFSIPPLLYHLPSVFESAHFDTRRRGESQLHCLKHLYEEHDAKSFAEGKQFIIPLPRSLHSPFIPSIQSLQLRYYRERRKKCNRFEEKNRRQLLESGRSCWDAFSPPEENPVFLVLLPAPQVRQMLGLFLQFQNNHGQLKPQDVVPSCCSSSPNQRQVLHEPCQTSLTKSHKQREVKENPQRDCTLCSWNRSSISTLLLTLNTNICPC